MHILKEKRIYAIMVLLIISLIFVENKAYARVYVNDSGVTEDIEEDDDIEVEPLYDEDDNPIEEGGEDDSEGPSIGPGEGIDGGSTLPVFETVSGNKIWMGWRKYHYNFIQNPIVKKGEVVSFFTRIINTLTGGEVVREGSATATGYGTYMMNYKRHMIGLLNYIKQNIKRMTYTGIASSDDISSFETDSSKPKIQSYQGCDYMSNMIKSRDEQDTNGDGRQWITYYSMSDACDYVMKKIAATGYSSTYENTEFKDFWDYCFKEDKKEILNSLQTNFYYRAYAKNAISKLRSMGFPFPSDSTGYKPAIYGMIFSIMEARYRNRDINGKLNLELKVAEGDLWPFLVNLKNLDKVVRTGTSGHYTYKIDGHDIGREDWPSLNDVVDGAYQWMAYYESGFMESTSASTVSMSQIEEEADDDTDSTDWESEYMELTNEECLPDVDRSFYEKVSIVRSTFKKSSDNTEGIFGAEEIYNIESEITLTKAMENMKECMINTFGKDVWEGLKDYNIERSYLLAKNIVENERLKSEYSYYNIGTNIIDATPGQKGNEYLLADFQRIKLKEPIKGKDGAFTNCDTDNDGLLDRDELGSRDSSGNGEKEVDITAFIETMIRSELLGRGEVSRDSTDEAILEATMQEFKTNLINRRQEVSEENEGDVNGTQEQQVKAVMNIVDVEEVNEYYLKCEGDKLLVTLYDYKSNPILKDTDFDGLSDYEEKEINTNRLDNSLSGNVDTIDGHIENANTHMDYRYFFMNNKVYYDELSTMSLMICNALENRGVEGSGSFKDISSIIDNIGMRTIYQRKDNDLNYVEVPIKEAYDEYGSEGLLKPKKSKVEYATGIHEVEYTHNYEETPISKKVKLIAIKSIDSNQGNIEGIGRNDREKEYNVFTKADHETFDKLANSIFAKEYEGNEYCYWVVGHGTGGAIANILAAKLIQYGKTYVPKGGSNSENINSVYLTFDENASNVYEKSTEISKHNKVISNVYCYTFGSPYTVYSGRDYLNLGNDIVSCHNDIFSSIFNVLNEDDIVAYLPSGLLGWDRYGAIVVLRKENINAEYKTTKDAISKVEKFDGSSGYEYKGNKEKRIQIEEAFYNIFYNNEENMKEYYYDKESKLEAILGDIVKEYMQTNGKLTNTLKKVTKGQYGNIDIVLENNLILFMLNLTSKEVTNGSYVSPSRDEAVMSARDTGAYYYLSKALKPENVLSMKLSNDINRNKSYYELPAITRALTAKIKEVGKWYTTNVATQMGALESVLLFNDVDSWKKRYIVLRMYGDRSTSGGKGQAGTPAPKYVALNEDELRGDDVNNIVIDLQNEEEKTALNQTRSNYSGVSDLDEMIARLNNLYKLYDSEDESDPFYKYKAPILKASEKQLKNYEKSYNSINMQSSGLEPGVYYYPNDDLKSANKLYEKAGDDCVRFAWTVFTLLKKDFPTKVKDYMNQLKVRDASGNWIVPKDNNGNKIDFSLNTINSFRLCGAHRDKYEQDEINNHKYENDISSGVEYAMYKLGFDIYDVDDEKINDYKLNNDDNKIYKINKIDNNFKLQPGDLLVRGTHVEFYMGNTDTKNISDSIGWGEVYTSFPKHINYELVDTVIGRRFGGESGNYARVYRYTGKER